MRAFQVAKGSNKTDKTAKQNGKNKRGVSDDYVELNEFRYFLITLR